MSDEKKQEKGWYRKLMDKVNPNRKKMNEAYDKAREKRKKKKKAGY